MIKMTDREGDMHFIQFLKRGKKMLYPIRGKLPLDAITKAAKRVKQFKNYSEYKADNASYSGLQDAVELDENLLLGSVVLYANLEHSMMLKALLDIARQ
jgi:hypothetical protein